MEKRNIDAKLNWFEQIMFKRITKKLVKQDSDHDKCITGFFRTMIDAARNEFNQDTEQSLNAHLNEWFKKALKR